MRALTVEVHNLCCAHSAVPSTAEKVLAAQTIGQPVLAQFLNVHCITHFSPEDQQTFHLHGSFSLSKQDDQLLNCIEFGCHCLEGLSIP